MVYNWIKNSLSRLQQQQCLLCLAPSRQALCRDCEADLPLNLVRCVICSLPLHGTENSSLVCGKCQQKPPQFNTSLIPYLYTTPLKQLISQLKFNYKLAHVPLLAELFLHRFPSQRHRLPECIIPVPLHRQRLKQRGFNQSLEIARLLGKNLDLTVEHRLCQRIIATPFQRELSAKERQKNLQNAFSVEPGHGYRHVAIFDDVMTTGATANELARVLKQSGVEIIEIWAIARTPEKGKG